MSFYKTKYTPLCKACDACRCVFCISKDVAIRGQAAETSAAMRITAKCRATGNLKGEYGNGSVLSLDQARPGAREP